MTRTEFSKIILLLNAAYKTKDYVMIADKMQADMWYEMLKDLEYEICTKAVRNLVARSPYEPKISDVRSEYARLVQPKYMTAQEAWTIVRDAIRGNTAFEELPSIIQETVVDSSQLWEWGQCSSREVDTVIQGYFKKAYDNVVNRKVDDVVIGQIGAKDGEYFIEEKVQRIDKMLEEKYD